MKKRVSFLILLVLGLLFLSCAHQKIKSDATIEERMDYGLKLYEKGKYFDAKTQFRIITLSHSGNLLAAKAQYYLGMCHFNMKEYIIAASEFERLLKVYPSSEWVDDAKYMLGLSYFKLSPKYALDQEYTYKAITEFQEFLEDYPGSELAPKVEDNLKQARHKLARKVFESAEIYRKMAYYRSAAIYYSKVLEEYYDTDFAPRALYWLGECHRRLHEYDTALESLNEFLRKYPKHDLAPKVRAKIKQVREDAKDYQRKKAKEKAAEEKGAF